MFPTPLNSSQDDNCAAKTVEEHEEGLGWQLSV
jgi:hypothetical protein